MIPLTATLVRAASGLMSKKSEPAKARAMTASPAAIRAWVRASRVNGDTTNESAPTRRVFIGCQPVSLNASIGTEANRRL